MLYKIYNSSELIISLIIVIEIYSMDLIIFINSINLINPEHRKYYNANNEIGKF